MAPLRTALTTAALRRATQRFVSVGGRSTAVPLVHIKISSSVSRSVFSPRGFRDLGKARVTSDSNEDFIEAGSLTVSLFCARSRLRFAPLSREHFLSSLSQ